MMCENKLCARAEKNATCKQSTTTREKTRSKEIRQAVEDEKPVVTQHMADLINNDPDATWRAVVRESAQRD